eukprot:TRINITY_DN10493_c0_g1_i3.p1 TRINITY_DN10493_c0_g1~~TRINITY_DN10493_c0_g1_i3.p1  ORF type:complete len:1477 (+),score=471.30 TRINITY_DN10493_c0_g1_i3:132-4562(+)
MAAAAAAAAAASAKEGVKTDHASFFTVCAADATGISKKFPFDVSASLGDQIRNICEEFDIEFDENDNYHVLTAGVDDKAARIRSIAELGTTKSGQKLGLRRGVDLVAERLDMLRESLMAADGEADLLRPLRSCLSAISGDTWLVDEMIANDCIVEFLRAVLQAAGDAGNAVIETAMCGLCELFQSPRRCREKLLESPPEELSVEFFRKVLAWIFPPSGSSLRLPRVPNAALCACLYLINTFPDLCARHAHDAACGAAGSEALYGRIVGCIDAETADFHSNAALSFIASLVISAPGDADMRRSLRAEIAALEASEGPSFSEELFTACNEPKNLVENVLVAAMAACTALGGCGGPGGPGHSSPAQLEEMQQLEKRVSHLQEMKNNLNADLRAKQKILLKMVPFVKIPHAPNVEKGLEGVIKFSWAGVHWSKNYNLLHYAAENVEDPAVVELVGLLCTDVDQKDDRGFRPIDYTRQAKRPACEKVINRLRQDQARHNKLKAGCAEAHVGAADSHSGGFLKPPAPAAPGGGGGLGHGLLKPPSAGYKQAPRTLSPRSAAAEKDRLQERMQGLTGHPQLLPHLKKACHTVINKGWDLVTWPNDFSGLHLAAKSGHKEAVQLLLDASASPGLVLQDDKGMRPVDYARAKGHMELVELLEKAAAGGPASASAAAPQSPSGGSGAGGAGGGEAGQGGEGSSQAAPSPVDLIGIRSQRPRDKAVDDLGLEELRKELLRLKEEKGALQKERDSMLQKMPNDGSIGTAASSGLLGGGPLGDKDVKTYLKQLETFGRDALQVKLTEAPSVGGLSLSDEEATRALQQLEFLQQLLGEFNKSSSSEGSPAGGGKGPPPPGGKGPPPPGGKGPPPPGCKGSPPPGGKGPPAPAPAGGKGPPPPGGKGPPPPGGKAKGPPPPGGKGPPPPGGKGPALPGGKGPAAPGGKGGKKGKGGKDGCTKPKITPKAAMKPLWWKRLLKGKQLEEGKTIWDQVGDDMNLIDEETLVGRFSKTAQASTGQERHLFARSDHGGDRNKLRARAKKVEKEDHHEKKEKKEEVTLLRTVTAGLDPMMVAGKEAALRPLPPPEECKQAVIELDDARLDVDLLSILEVHVRPTDEDMKQLTEARQKHPGAPLAKIEEYMSVLGEITAYRHRLDCWVFVRTYEEKEVSYRAALNGLLSVVQCFKESEMLPTVLGLILAVGNYLNGGTNRGQADGFELEALTKLDSVKDADGKDVRSFVLDTLFNGMTEKASDWVEKDFAPFWSSITRRLNKDSDGAESLGKDARVGIEDIDTSVSALAVDLEMKSQMMQVVLQYSEDPADQFRLRMPEVFAKAKTEIDDLVSLRDKAKAAYGELLEWFRIEKMKSADFLLLWDDFFIPADLITGRPNKLKQEFLVPAFCRNKPVSVHQLMVLWEMAEPDAKADARERRRAAGGRRRRGEEKRHPRRAMPSSPTSSPTKKSLGALSAGSEDSKAAGAVAADVAPAATS